MKHLESLVGKNVIVPWAITLLPKAKDRRELRVIAVTANTLTVVEPR